MSGDVTRSEIDQQIERTESRLSGRMDAINTALVALEKAQTQSNILATQATYGTESLEKELRHHREQTLTIIDTLKGQVNGLNADLKTYHGSTIKLQSEVSALVDSIHAERQAKEKRGNRIWDFSVKTISPIATLILQVVLFGLLLAITRNMQ